MALQQAIRQGDFGTARALLDEQEESLDHVDDQKETALSCAAAIGSQELVEALLTRRAKVTADIVVGGMGPICAAAKHGHISIVGLLLSKDIDPDLTGDIHETPLSLAATWGHLEVVEFLISRGAKLNPERRFRPLSSAVEEGRIEIVKILIEGGANPNRAADTGQGPLLVATRLQYIEIMKILVENGANPDGADRQHRTPLSVAAENGHIEAIKFLVGYGANSNSPDDDGRTPFLIAVNNGHTEVVQFLTENGADMNPSTLHNSLALAVRNGSMEIVQWLLDKGATPDFANKSDQTPLFTAAEHGRVDIVQILIHHGANPNLLNGSDQTPLSIAAERGHFDVVQFLVQNTADPNLPVRVNKTPLYLAAVGGHAQIVEYLIQKGTNPGAIHLPEDMFNGLVNVIEFNEFAQLILDHIANGVLEEEMDTPNKALIDERKAITELMDIGGELSFEPCKYSWLLWAARYGNCNCIQRTYFDWSKSNKIFNSQHQTPLLLAAQHGNYDFVQCSISSGRVVDPRCTGSKNEGRTPLSFAAEGGFSDITELLLNYGADQSIKSTGENWRGQIPLSIAAAKGHWEVVGKLLSDASFEPDFQDSTGRTPLWWAASGGQAQTVEKLLGRGALTDLRDEDGLTSLLVAASNGHEKVVRRLIDLGNMSLKDNNGHTALWLALLNGHHEVAQILMERDETTLHCMVERNDLATAEILLNAGYSTEKVDSKGLTPLRLALRLRSPEFARILLRYSASSRDIQASEWLEAFTRDHSGILQLSVSEDGGQIDFLPHNSPPAHTNMKTRIW